MNNLPEKGLIVSCYLEGMEGSEKAFIASVIHYPQVVAVRVEGLKNIRFARRIAPEKFIIGLVKRFNGYRNLITPTQEDMHGVIDAGADMVATEEWHEYLKMAMITRYGAYVRHRGMFDLSFSKYFNMQNSLARNINLLATYNYDINSQEIILATTFENKGYSLLQKMKERPGVLVNFEGGVLCSAHIQKAFDLGADWVTIGKAINDPETIIDNLLKPVRIDKP